MSEPEFTASLWDWRRRVADMWATIRGMDDPEAAWRYWRTTREDLFRTHPQTPLEPGGASLPTYFEYDPTLRFAVDLSSPAISEPMYVPVGEGTVELTPFATTSGLLNALGGELTLYWLGGYGGGVFLPLLDATSGPETYGGGRYLLDTIKSADHGLDANGRTILDFNFAYNPSCYYSPRWVCPLAPRTNRVPQPIRGGERADVH